jgi:hypothetical protein
MTRIFQKQFTSKKLKINKRSFRASYLTILCSFLLSACTPEPKGFEPDPGNADFNQVIALGGSFMAGYQDGGLFLKAQENSLAAQIANQLELAKGSKFYQALLPSGAGIGLNSKPWEGSYVSPSRLGLKTDCKGVTSTSPVKMILSEIEAQKYLSAKYTEPINDFTVPFASMNDYINPSFGLSSVVNFNNPFYARIASKPGSSTILSDAKDRKPSFIISWLGMDDIYNYASKGGTHHSIPTAAEFEQQLDLILGDFAKSGVKGVMATIPDFRDFPFYTLIPWDNADLTQVQADSLNLTYQSNALFSHISFEKGRNGFVVEDPNEPSGFRQLKAGEYITISVPTDSLKCYKYGLLVKPINNRYSLIESEVNIIDNAISSYNSIIVKKAAEYGFAMADIHQLFKRVKSGIKWNGADFNLDFVSGGFLSLDGYHPNQKGYAIIANEFIKAINDTYKANVPQSTCNNCDGVLFN